MEWAVDNTQGLIDERTRERIRKYKRDRQFAVAQFPLRVIQVAMDMQKMLNILDYGSETDKAEEYLDYCEKLIRKEYRSLFGTELGNGYLNNDVE